MAEILVGVEMFSENLHLIKIFCTIPVTTLMAERSFSVLRRQYIPEKHDDSTQIKSCNDSLCTQREDR